MKEHKPYVTVTHGIRGYFAVLMTWDEEYGAYSPWDSAYSSWDTSEKADIDGKKWADEKGLLFVSYKSSITAPIGWEDEQELLKRKE